MTKTQRQKHIADINTVLEQAGAELNRFGIYHLNGYRFDTREVNLKVYKGKIKVQSTPMTKLSILEFQNYVNKISKSE